MMKENDINSLMFETINRIRKIESSKVSMWAIDNKYAHPPYFRFRFENIQEDDVIYEMLRGLITQFKGSLEWEMIHDGKKSANFLILPKAFSPFVFKDGFRFERQSFLDFLPQVDYESIIDKAISDVPLLAEYIAEQGRVSI